MAYETLVAVYDTPAHADAAVKALKAAGFAESDISVFDSARLKGGRSTMAAGVKEPGLWQRLFGTDVYQHEASIYGETIDEMAPQALEIAQNGLRENKSPVCGPWLREPMTRTPHHRLAHRQDVCSTK